MAIIARPFTYNNGSTIPGTLQIGNLAVGVIPAEYSKQPGGKEWWMGPNETGKWVIVKDVPASNWPTPLGNIGSIRYWNTKTQNDPQFINETNKLPARSGQTPFTTASDAYNWLISNGYWTNYVGANSASYYNNIFVDIDYQDVSSQYDVTQWVYSSTYDKMYGLPASWYTSPLTPGNFQISNVSSQVLGTDIYLTQSSDFLPSYTVPGGSRIGTRGMGIIDNDNDYYYVNSPGFNLTGTVLMKYDLSNNSITAYSTESEATFAYPGLTRDKNKLLMGGQAYIRVYNTSDLSVSGSIDLTGAGDVGTYGTMFLTNTDNGDVLLVGKDKWSIWDIDSLQLISSGSWPFDASSIRNWPGTSTIQGNSAGFGLFLPSSSLDSNSGKYFLGVSLGNTQKGMLSIDATTYEVNITEFTSTRSKSSSGTTALAYDSQRKVIWGTDKSGFFVAADPKTETVVFNSSVSILPQTLLDSTLKNFTMLNEVVDDRLFVGGSGYYYSYNSGSSQTFSLQNLWPI